MSTIKEDTIGGFNTFLKEQQGMKGEAKLTMVLFDHEYIVKYDGEAIGKVEPLDDTSYVPRGTTALFDAIGRAITSVRERDETEGAGKARIMVVIITDGVENASREYNHADIFDMIKNCEDNLKWAFLYLSASPDAFANAEYIGINSTHTIGFSHDCGGSRGMSMAYNCATNDFRNTGSVGTSQMYALRVDPEKKHLNTQ